MTAFSPVSERMILGGVQRRYQFANGYGASVVRHMYSYGGNDGLWELAVTDRAGNLCYSTPITDDVLGYLGDADVDECLARIDALPEAPA